MNRYISVVLQLINFIPLSKGRRLMFMIASALLIFRGNAECLGQWLMSMTTSDLLILEKMQKASMYFR
jgi:hypothetical protein